MKGTPRTASQSATSVAKVKPSGAWRRSSSVRTRMVRTIPAMAGRTRLRVSTVSRTSFLSSARSRL
ncbi:hypothetical protein D3C76_1819570 [compost metagenome]